MKTTSLPFLNCFRGSAVTARGEGGNDISGMYQNLVVVKIVLDTHVARSAYECKSSSSKKSITAEGLYSLRFSENDSSWCLWRNYESSLLS